MNIDDNIDLHEIVNNLYNLQTRFNELTNSLEKGILPINDKLTRAIIISGYLLNQTIKPLKVAKKDLIKFYNECPTILEEYAIEVELTHDSYFGIQNKIFLTRSTNGSYWVILTLTKNEEEKFFWLLPNGNKNNFRSFSTETIEKLFEIKSTNNSSEEIILIEPGKLEIYTDNNNWQLINKGVVQKGGIMPSSHTSFELEKIYLQQQQLKLDIAKITQEVNILKSSKNKFNNQSLNKKIETIEDKFNKFSEKLSLQIPNLFKQQRELKSSIELLKKSSFKNSLLKDKPMDYINFINLYNKNPDKLKHQVIIASETQQSIKNRFSGNSDELIFQENINGVYWIFQCNDSFYLVLDNHQHLDIQTIAIEKTLKLLFKCQNYEALNQKIYPILVKPAKVIPITNSPKKWKLEKLGILEFKNLKD